MGKMKLYWWPRFRSVRLIWLIKELGVEDDVEYVLAPRRDDSELFASYCKEVHPHGTIPALVVPDETTIIESGAACLYLAERYKKMLPDINNRHDYYNYILYAVSTLDPIMTFFYFELILKKAHDKDELDKMKAKTKVALDYLTDKLQGKEFLCGDSITAADCVVGYNISAFDALSQGALLKDHPVIQKYNQRITDRDSFKAASGKTA